MLTVQTIISKVQEHGIFTIPTDLEGFGNEMIQASNHGNRLFDKLEAKYGIKMGIFQFVKDLIVEDRKANTITTKTAKEAQIDRIERYVSQKR